MAAGDQSNPSRPKSSPLRRVRATDERQDAAVRREEEFRRFLVSVVTPAFDELRAVFRASGREARAKVTTRPGQPAEATITVSHRGEVEFFCTIHAAISPEQATVLKRRPVPGAVREDPPAVEEALLNHSEHQSNATIITRAEVVVSIRTDYWVLRR
ncbi:MAG: hypothetical protein M3464_04090 [Chloroflexota bacterium]|nr:hypothetical protein [Chloroflexota bacterium]